MATGRKTGGRQKGSPNKRTVARRLAETEAMCALPEQFQGNALALLQMIYRDTKLELRVRIDAASKALAYELPKPEFATPFSDVVPLHVRIRGLCPRAPVSAAEAEKIKAAIELLGCSGGKMEKETEGSGYFEVDDARCRDGQYDIKLDKDFKVIVMSRD
jgi:hypothetical protein